MDAQDERIRRLDSAGMTASTLCAIHCSVMPLAIGALTAAGVSWIRNEALEWGILGGSIVIGLFALLPSYRRVHRHSRCLWMFWIGVLAIVSGRLGQIRSLPDTPFVVCGAALIVSSHALNRYFCARCARCGESTGESDKIGRDSHEKHTRNSVGMERRFARLRAIRKRETEPP